MDPKAVIAAVGGLPASRFTGPAYRHIAIGYQPLSGEGARLVGGRWNPPASFPVLYLALERRTVAAELRRSAARQALKPEDLMPRDLLSYDVQLQRVLDLRDEEVRRQVGIEPDLHIDEVSASQVVGEAAHLIGFEAVTAPSAAGDGEILAVFLDRLLPRSAVRDVSSERWTDLADVDA